ncbi:helix-turn-helix transcriptional regulator [Collinsella phocaeensis]|uniref:helix-turn-helix transcriptional regulator n=1 Tax=Collinsella phocaeensis TaxID=1871016 RepID=UPI0009319EBF|nr:helix-turn-helix transcriptional regulator [Collinsella phocaeensis]
MVRIVDILVVFTACAVSFVAHSTLDAGVVDTAGAGVLLPFGDIAASASVVACLLVAVIAVLGCEWARSGWRSLAPVFFCALSAVVPEGLFFVPAATYELCRFIRDPLPWRAAPLAVPIPFACAAAVHHVPAGAIVLSAALCALAALVSMRTSALLAQRDLRHRAWDEYRERELVEVEGRLVRGRVDFDSRVTGAADRPDGTSAADAEPAHAVMLPHLAALSTDGRCRAAFSQLTDREYEVVALIAEGLDNHEIAAAAFISEGTVRNRISSSLQKTGYKNRTQLAVAWWQAREG